MFFDPTAPKVSYEGTKRVRLFRKQVLTEFLQDANLALADLQSGRLCSGNIRERNLSGTRWRNSVFDSSYQIYFK